MKIAEVAFVIQEIVCLQRFNLDKKKVFLLFVSLHPTEPRILRSNKYLEYGKKCRRTKKLCKFQDLML